MNNDIIIEAVNPDSHDAVSLTNKLFEELEELYGKGTIEDFLSENHLFSKFIIIKINNEPAGCGALRHINERTAEIKRMYVPDSFRGKGISKAILNELEKLAGQNNYQRIILETGVRQPAAVHLYEKNGYKRIECYGRFANDPDSLCYEKVLV